MLKLTLYLRNGWSNMKKIIISILGVLLLVPSFGVNTAKADEQVKSDQILAVTVPTVLYAKDNNGNFTKVKTRSVGAYSTWYSDQSYYSGNEQQQYYRVSTNEWVKTDDTVIVQMHNFKMDAQVDNDQHINAKVIKINNAAASIYDDFGRKTGQTVPANTSWKVDMNFLVGTPGIDGFAAYQRIGTNAWIQLSDDATVTETL